MYFRNICEITLNKKFANDFQKKFKNKITEKGDKMIVEDDLEKPIIDFCEGIAIRNKEKIEVKDKEGLIIDIESFGQIAPDEIFMKATDILKKNLTELGKHIK